MAEIASMPPFDPLEQTDRVGPRWDRWKTRLQFYIDARGITVDNRKPALLLHLAGPAVQETSSLRYQTLGPLTRRRLLRWTRTSLLRRASNSNNTPFARLIKRQTNRLLNTSHDYGDWVSIVSSINIRSTRLLINWILSFHHTSWAPPSRKIHCFSQFIVGYCLLHGVGQFSGGEHWECLIPGMVGKRSPTDNANNQRRRTTEFYFGEAATMYTLR